MFCYPSSSWLCFFVDFSHVILYVYMGVCMCMWMCVFLCVCLCVCKRVPGFLLSWYHQQLKTSILTDSGKKHHRQADRQTDHPIEMHRRILESKIQLKFFFQMPKTPSFYPCFYRNDNWSKTHGSPHANHHYAVIVYMYRIRDYIIIPWRHWATQRVILSQCMLTDKEPNKLMPK